MTQRSGAVQCKKPCRAVLLSSRYNISTWRRVLLACRWRRTQAEKSPIKVKLMREKSKAVWLTHKDEAMGNFILVVPVLYNQGVQPWLTAAVFRVYFCVNLRWIFKKSISYFLNDTVHGLSQGLIKSEWTFIIIFFRVLLNFAKNINVCLYMLAYSANINMSGTAQNEH